MYINMYGIFNSSLLKIKTLFTLDNSNRKATIRVSNNTHTSGQILESFLICNILTFSSILGIKRSINTHFRL